MDPGTSWIAGGTIVTAGATVFLAWFARLQIRALQAERTTRTKSATSHVGAAAFLARRQIRSWIGEGSGSPDDLESWLRMTQNAGTFGMHIDRAEARFVDILEQASTATPEIAARAREAAALFFNGTRRLNEFAAMSQPMDADELDRFSTLREMAWTDLRDCVLLIDTELETDGLLQYAREKDAQRRAEHPTLESLIDRSISQLEGEKD